MVKYGAELAWGSSIIWAYQIIAQADLFTSAIGQLGISAVAMWVLWDQSKDAKKQITELTVKFLDSIEKERESRYIHLGKIGERVGTDHQQCRLDHQALNDTLRTVVETLDRIEKDFESCPCCGWKKVTPDNQEIVLGMPAKKESHP